MTKRTTTIKAPPAAPILASAIGSHSTSTTDDAWDGAANVKNLSNDDGEAEYRAMFAWVDPDKDPDTKAAYKFPHHMVAADGTVGAANTHACSAVVGALNGGRGGANIPDADRQGVFAHVVKHLKDAGVSGDDLPVLAAAEPAAGLPERWVACLVVEGFRTTDHRAIAPGVLTWRDLPLPLAAQFSNEGGHYGSVPVGTIETITRDGARILATGTFDLGSDDGQEAARLCDQQIMRFVSVDLEVIDSAYFETEDDWYEEVLAGRIGMTTMVMFPAFPQACIVPEDVALPEPAPLGDVPMTPAVPLLADGGIDLAAPPAEWFADPQLAELTHLTVGDDGRVFGHLAGWGIAHRGIQGRTVYAPRSASNYAHFATGTTVCAGGERVATGVLTMGGGHADGRLALRPAAAHYDDVCSGAADVAVGEDDYGIWLAGAVRPGVQADVLRVLRASDVSGDWRPTTAGHELVAALVVNVAGFLIPNSLVASAAYAAVGAAAFAQYAHEGEPGALVAAGMVRRADPISELRREVGTLRAAIMPLMPLAAAALTDAIETGIGA